MKTERRVTVTKRRNPYREFVKSLGREEKDTTLPNPWGATSLRTWPCGCSIVRSVESGVLYDEPDAREKHRNALTKAFKENNTRQERGGKSAHI